VKYTFPKPTVTDLGRRPPTTRRPTRRGRRRQELRGQARTATSTIAAALLKKARDEGRDPSSLDIRPSSRRPWTRPSPTWRHGDHHPRRGCQSEPGDPGGAHLRRPHNRRGRAHRRAGAHDHRSLRTALAVSRDWAPARHGGRGEGRPAAAPPASATRASTLRRREAADLPEDPVTLLGASWSHTRGRPARFPGRQEEPTPTHHHRHRHAVRMTSPRPQPPSWPTG